MAYNVNISPQWGQGAYGAVPGNIALPNPQSDLASVIPNLGTTTGQLSQNILNESRGMLNPETIRNIQDTAAQWGVGSGMPGSGLQQNLGLRSLGLTSQGLQEQGLGDYLNFTKGVAGTQTVSPELQTNIADRNALFGAAPNPTAANTMAQSLFNNSYNQAGGNPWLARQGGPARVTGMPNLGTSQDVFRNNPALGTTPLFATAAGVNQYPGPNFGTAVAPAQFPTGNMYGGYGNDTMDPNDPNSSAYDAISPYASEYNDYGLNPDVPGGNFKPDYSVGDYNQYY